MPFFYDHLPTPGPQPGAPCGTSSCDPEAGRVDVAQYVSQEDARLKEWPRGRPLSTVAPSKTRELKKQKQVPTYPQKFN